MHLRNQALAPTDLLAKTETLFTKSAAKIDALERRWLPQHGSPVFTVDGQYMARGWTEWTQGFQFGAAILQFDATGDAHFLELGRTRTLERMASHLTHVGVHDHGFNNVSTYGNLWRLAVEGRVQASDWERHFYELALKVSGAVQARRWTRLPDGGFIHSFNGPHSLFVDTIRSLRSLALAHRLGHRLSEEQDAQISLLARLVQHAKATAGFSVYYGRGRDSYDVRGRTTHEAIFNTVNGSFRGPNSQQGYSPFSTWTRGLAWAMLGFAEQLEFLQTVGDDDLSPPGRPEYDAELRRVDRSPTGRAAIEWMMREAAWATCDFYLDHATASDGIPYWDTGAPGLAHLPGWQDRPADPFNDYEPVDSSAACIAAQGLLRFGRYLNTRGDDGARYAQAGLEILDVLFDPAGPYLSTNEGHEGLILHSVYHRPNGWDHQPEGSAIPRGESSQWGDYHAREAALYVRRLATDAPYFAFFGPEAVR
jgi:unsaturated chondroitin disaccharide hydrolase